MHLDYLRFMARTQPKMFALAVMPALFFCFTAVTFVLWLRRKIMRLTCTAEASAVLEHIEEDERGSSRLYTLRFRAEGGEVRVTRQVPFARDIYSMGQTLHVRYNPARPADRLVVEELDGRGSLWPLGAALLAASLLAMPAQLRRRVYAPIRLPAEVFHTDDGQGKEELRAQGDFSYALQADGRAELRGYTGRAESLTLPVMVDGHLVSGISPSAFFINATLRELTVPAFFGTVPATTFFHCTGLRRVILEEGIRSVGTMAFRECGELEEVYLPESITFLGARVFPDDCRAVFYVAPGSQAEAYCLRCGYRTAVMSP